MTQPPNGTQSPGPYHQPTYQPAGPAGYPPSQQQPPPQSRPGGYPQGPQQPWPGQPNGYPSGQQQAMRQAPPGMPPPPVQQPGMRRSPNQPGPNQPVPNQPGPIQRAAPQPSAAAAPAPKKAKGSPGLGAIGLLLVVIAGVAALGTTYFLGRAIGWTTAEATILKTCVQSADVATCEAQANNLPQAVAVLHQLELWGSVLGAAALVGLVAWILCIVAAATRRGKGLGVTGIILGIVIVLGIVGATIAFWAYFNAASTPT